MRQPVAQLNAALTVLFVADLQRHDLRVQRAIGADDGARPLSVEGRLLRVGELGFVVGLAGESIECRLWIKRFELTDAAGEENPDDVLGARREMRFAAG